MTPEQIKELCERVEQGGDPADRRILSIVLKLREYAVGHKDVDVPVSLINDALWALEELSKE